MCSMKEKIEYAYAKVNVTLEVTGKRSDGYHELRSIFLPLEFHDFIQVRVQAGTQKITLISDYPRLNNQYNLMYKAAQLFLEHYGLMYDVEIEYTKEIPSQAGLGGGSADAAAVMRALRDIFSIALSDQEAVNLCRKIGADVPFCYFNKPAYVSGIGDELSFFENRYAPHVVLIKPKKGASTKKIFETLQIRSDHSQNVTAEMKEALRMNDGLLVGRSLINDLERAAFALVPEIEKIKKELVNEGIRTCVMSGSGSTIVCLIENEHLARRIVRQYKNKGNFAIHTKFLKETV